MAVSAQVITDRYAIYNGDRIEVMQALPKEKIHLSIYSPPFGGLYHLQQQRPRSVELRRLRAVFRALRFRGSRVASDHDAGPTDRSPLHGRFPRSNSGRDSYRDFPGDIIRLHERKDGIHRAACDLKEPFEVRLRTMQKNLAHKTLIDDSTLCGVAGADYL